ncbi:MAG: diadenylate cyclase [Bacteroidaceae bacterium]|nr:diadenylate cyclase [Bacteroidaceae bacterium]
MWDTLLKISIKDALDIICIAILMFNFYKLMLRSGSLNKFIGIAFFFIIWVVVTQIFDMPMLSSVLNKLVEVGVVALIIIFAEDIRGFLGKVGDRTRESSRFFSWFVSSRKNSNVAKPEYVNIVESCASLSKNKVGALIIIEQSMDITPYINILSVIDAVPNQSLIENIFFKNSPLHDGALIVRDNRLYAAGCFVKNPSISESLPKHFGSRHRAAMGLCEQTDAVVIVVSEETGRMSIFHNSSYNLNLTKGVMMEYIKNIE